MASDDRPGSPGKSGMFQEPEREARGLPTAAIAIAIAGVTVLIVLALFLALGRHRAPASSQGGRVGLDTSYAPHLQLSDLQMSESTSFSGSKETFVDGRIVNNGPATVDGAEVLVSFPADGGGAPQQETVPVTLIRTRQPYIDVQPLSAAPLAPGAAAEFRLTFDDVKLDWNQQTPLLKVTGVSKR